LRDFSYKPEEGVILAPRKFDILLTVLEFFKVIFSFSGNRGRKSFKLRNNCQALRIKKRRPRRSYSRINLIRRTFWMT
jgi:hypothetical protein